MNVAKSEWLCLLLASFAAIFALRCTSDDVSPGQQGPTLLEPRQLFEAYANRLNAGAIDPLLELFTEDAVLQPGGPGGGGRCPDGRCMGREAIRLQIQGQIADEHQVQALASEQVAQGLSGRYELRSRMTRMRQTERIVFTFALEERDGRISQLRFEPDLTDPTTATFFERRQPP